MLLLRRYTINSRFKLQLNLHEHFVSTLKVNSKKASIIQKSIISENIVSEIYNEVLSESTFNLSEIDILAPKTDHCKEINYKVLKLLPGNVKTYTNINYLITMVKSEVLQFFTEFLSGFEVSALSPYTLRLKEAYSYVVKEFEFAERSTKCNTANSYKNVRE